MANAQYDASNRPYSMSASLIVDDFDDPESDADGPALPRTGWVAVRHAVRKNWHRYRHSFTVCVLLLMCFTLVVCFYSTTGVVEGGNAPPQEAWLAVPQLSTVNTSEFRAFVGPLAEMSMNAQTWPRTRPVEGWQLARDGLGFLGSIKGGVHALTYVDVDYNNTQQVVVAFRGVNFADTLDGLADRCADFLLWSGGFKEGRDFEFPFQCQEKFTDLTLDYYSQAIDHTRNVLETYPGASILLTGHGLGAGLALLVSTSNLSPLTGPMPVVAFSAPSVGHALKGRNLKMWRAEGKLVYIIGDRWDGEMSIMTEKKMKGHVCLYESARPDSCARCQVEREVEDGHHRRLLGSASKGVVSEPSVSQYCKECSRETHDLSHVVSLVSTQERPVCT